MKSWWNVIKAALVCLAARLRLINPIVPYPSGDYLKRADEHVWNKLCNLRVADVENLVHQWLLTKTIYDEKLTELISSFDYEGRDYAHIPSMRGSFRRVKRRRLLEVVLCPDGLFIAMFIVYEDGADKPEYRQRAYQSSGRQRYKFRFIEEAELTVEGELHYRTLRYADRDFSLNDRQVRIACHFKPEELPEEIQALLPTTKQRIAK